jgi:hypothetical protein
MRSAATLPFDAYVARNTGPARWPERTDARWRASRSAFRALQALPLSRLASNGTEHAHVRAVAILGYN